MGRRVLLGWLAVLVAASLAVVDGGPVSAQPQVGPDRSAPVETSVEPTGLVWAEVTAGDAHTCGLRANGSVWCWGRSHVGQLGLGNTTKRLVPTRVGTDFDWAEIAAGREHTCGVRTDRSLWCWGSNEDGQLGLGDDRQPRLEPTQVGTDVNWADVSAGSGYTCGVGTDGSLWCWGENDTGQLGLGDKSTRLVPTRVATGLDWAEISVSSSHTCGLREDRSMWCWGYNNSGQLGLGDRTERLIPTRVGADLDWSNMSTGALHSCGVRSDRSLWCWGHGLQGQLGLGDRDDRWVPTQVGTDLWTTVLADFYYTCGVRTNGSLWCWGNNKHGQLGIGNFETQLRPTRVGTDFDWAKLSGESTSGHHVCGVRANGSLWCWGLNRHGQLGLGDTVKRVIPARV